MVSLSHTVLNLAPACLGDTVAANIFANNVSAVEQVHLLRVKTKRKQTHPSKAVSSFSAAFWRPGCFALIPFRQLMRTLAFYLGFPSTYDFEHTRSHCLHVQLSRATVPCTNGQYEAGKDSKASEMLGDMGFRVREIGRVM